MPTKCTQRPDHEVMQALLAGGCEQCSSLSYSGGINRYFPNGIWIAKYWISLSICGRCVFFKGPYEKYRRK